MQTSIIHTISFFVIAILCQNPTLAAPSCRCLSNNPICWPNVSVWQNFNASVNGRLISPQPSAAVCNSYQPNVNACTIATQQWTNASWRGNQAGALQNHNWENSSCSISFNSTTCNQGSVPPLAVNATLPEHVQATLQLVNTYNLRLVMKTTGHDYLGRSTAAGSLLLWLHYMKNMTLIPTFSLCTGETITNTIRLGAGVQWGEVYKWLAPYNLTAIGGASGTVGATGGFLQGGGHGPLTRWKGLAADQVLEYDVIMADGRRQTVNACQNMDLFWALRGGGGGTFAVVLSVVLRTYPTPSVLVGSLAMTTSNETRYGNFIHNFVRLLPKLADVGWSGYFYLAGSGFIALFILPDGDAGVTMNQLTNNFTDLNISGPILLPSPSFNDFFVNILESSNPTGGNVLLGSRLIPETIVRNQPDQLADIFMQLNGQSSSVVIGHLVAGGQVSNVSQNNSVNSAWRSALLHMIYAQLWADGTSNSDQDKLAKHVTKQVELLQTMSGGSQSGAYMNEADPNEPNWQQKFFGSLENYNRLKSIKKAVDPNGLFVCRTCVGSDEWSDDLNCPKKSNVNRVHITGTLLFITEVFIWIF